VTSAGQHQGVRNPHQHPRERAVHGLHPRREQYPEPEQQAHAEDYNEAKWAILRQTWTAGAACRKE
jgi:hypothetical protein